MTTTNEHTGDTMRSRRPSKEYKDNWDRIFGNKKKDKEDKDKE